MTYAQFVLPEFDQEMASTRKVLERLPEDKWDWRPHPKSNTIGWNANHLADIPGWVENILTEPGFDYAPVGKPPFQSSKFTTRDEILQAFDRNVVSGRKALEAVKDERMGEDWSLLEGGKPVFTMSRTAVMRNFVLNHTVHHRAILLVYLRLNDIPVPGMYGPSGDE